LPPVSPLARRLRTKTESFQFINPIEKKKLPSLNAVVVAVWRPIPFETSRIHRAQTRATRHFPTRKTTRIALKTTLSIKRAQKI
jgi:hypothetical protein